MTLCLQCQKAICFTGDTEKTHTFKEELEEVLLTLTIVSHSEGMLRDNRRVFPWRRGWTGIREGKAASLCREVRTHRDPNEYMVFSSRLRVGAQHLHWVI